MKTKQKKKNYVKYVLYGAVVLTPIFVLSGLIVYSHFNNVEETRKEKALLRVAKDLDDLRLYLEQQGLGIDSYTEATCFRPSVKYGEGALSCSHTLFIRSVKKHTNQRTTAEMKKINEYVNSFGIKLNDAEDFEDPKVLKVGFARASIDTSMYSPTMYGDIKYEFYDESHIEARNRGSFIIEIYLAEYLENQIYEMKKY